MGYTHYWTQQRHFTDEEWTKICARAYKVFKDAEADGVALSYECDEPERAPLVDGEMIRFNGAGDEEGYETFILSKRAVPSFQAQTQGKVDVFNFCKTEHRPYDKAVVSILAIVKKIAPTACRVSSDGGNGAIRMFYGKLRG